MIANILNDILIGFRNLRNFTATQHRLGIKLFLCMHLFSGHARGKAGNFANWDKNEDGVITRDEVSNYQCTVNRFDIFNRFYILDYIIDRSKK